MRTYASVPFAAGQRDRAVLEANGSTPCLPAPSPASTASLKRTASWTASTLPQPVPPLTIPRNAPMASPRRSSGIPMSANGSRRRPTRCRTAATPTIEAQIEDIIDRLEKAQAPDGYLNCWYLEREPENRWTNLRDNHELYNCRPPAGRRRGLFPRHRPDALLEDHGALHGPYRRHLRPRPGPEARLSRAIRRSSWRWSNSTTLTGNRKWLDLATYFIDERGRAAALLRHRTRGPRRAGRAPSCQGTYEYNQSHLPVREQTKVVGHAVRAMYMYTAMADLAAEHGDAGLQPGLRDAVEGRHRDPDVCHRRLRPLGLERGLHPRLRPAQRHRLCRDLRLGGDGVLGGADAEPRPRRAICRHPGTGALQQFAGRASPRRRPIISTTTSWKATAATSAGTGTPAPAAR